MDEEQISRCFILVMSGKYSACTRDGLTPTRTLIDMVVTKKKHVHVWHEVKFGKE